MENKTQIIRTEIIRVLNESGKIRSSELIRRVSKKIDNKKMIYREISSLVESGEIERKIHDKSHIEYALIDLSELVNEQLKGIYNELEKNFAKFNKTYEIMTNDEKYQQRVRMITQLIHVTQATQSTMRLLSYYPSYKKDKMFSQINRKIDDIWKKTMDSIIHQPEEDFLNDVINNLRIKVNMQSIN